MSVSGLGYSIGQAPLDGLDTIYTNYINTDSIDINTALNGMPITYFTGTTSNLQNQIDAISGTLAGTTGNWGAFSCSSTLNNPTANVVRYAYVDTADPSGIGISLYGSAGGGLYQALQVSSAGVYNLQFSCQVSHTSSVSHNVYIWFRKNGTDVPGSASEFTLLGNNENQVPAWNYIFNLSAGDYVSVMWSCETTQFSMPAMSAQTTPVVIPAVPSVIITMQQITNLAVGATGPSGVTPNIGIGTVQGVAYGNSPQVTISGTTANPLLNFVLASGPQGAQGPTGPQGPKGERGNAAESTIEAIAAAGAAATSAGVAVGAATAAATSATAAATSATAAATSAVAAAGSATAAATSAAEAAATAASISADIAGLQAQIDVIDTSVTTLQDKTSNITAVPGVSTTITGTNGLYVDDITALAITSPGVLDITSTTSTALTSSGVIDVSTTGQLNLGGGTFSTLSSNVQVDILAPVVHINSGTTSGSISIGQSLLDAIYIQGLPFVNYNVNPFSQW